MVSRSPGRRRRSHGCDRFHGRDRRNGGHRSNRRAGGCWTDRGNRIYWRNGEHRIHGLDWFYGINRINGLDRGHRNDRCCRRSASEQYCVF